MWNAKQKEEAPWKLLLFFFTIRVIRGSLTEYYVRKLFTKCIGFQIHGFFFIPMCVYVHLNKCSILDWSGLEMFVKVLLMEQKCVGSTLRPFLSKKSHSCKIPMHNIDQMDFWSWGKCPVIRTRGFFFLILVLVLTWLHMWLLSHFSQCDCDLSSPYGNYFAILTYKISDKCR